MPIQFPVAPRTVLLCDYSRGGFQPPEMVKRRPVAVVSPRLPYRSDQLCAVVPLSGTEPIREVRYVVRIELAEDLPDPFPQRIWWVKCDMIATVGFHRLDLFRTARDPGGKRKYLHPKVGEDDFDRIRAGVLAGLGFT